MRLIPICFAVLFIISCASKPQVEDPVIVNDTVPEEQPIVEEEPDTLVIPDFSISNQFEVEIDPKTDIAIVVRDLVTVNSIATGLKMVKLMYEEPLIYIVEFDEELIAADTMKTALEAHPNVLSVGPAVSYDEVPIPNMPPPTIDESTEKGP